jgi:hypothetical protein
MKTLESFLSADLALRRLNYMKAKKFDSDFENGKDITKSLDLSKIKRPNQVQRRVNVDFPTWMIDSLDKEASRLGVTRQSIIKIWLAERLENLAHRNKCMQSDPAKLGR